MNTSVEIIEIILGLLVVVIALVTIARKFTIPYPILLVVGGLALGFLPRIPSVTLNPDLVFLLFLPPLLYWEALNTPIREFRANLRPILLLAVGLVLATTSIVAVVAHQFVGMPWPVAFVLGAILSPTDTVAASAIAQRLFLPRQVVAILEGESLLNDATALVAYSAASSVVVSGLFSPAQAGLQFVVASGGGIAIGLLVGLLIMLVRRVVHDPPVENTISLLTGFAAYLPAQALGCSAVLSVVAIGLFLERQGPRYVSPQTRLQATQMWQVVVFLLNGLLFILVGLQLNSILAAHELPSAMILLRDAALVCLAVIVVRIAWVFLSTALSHLLSRVWHTFDLLASWKYATILSWSGMRGGVSLAAALALSTSFPQRDLIVFLTFSVMLATLVLQGLTLPPLIRALHITDDGAVQQEELQARAKLMEAALARMDELSSEQDIPQNVIDMVRSHYNKHSKRLQAGTDGDDSIFTEQIAAFRRLQQELLTTKRKTLIDLRDRGVINDEVLRTIQRNIDIEETQLAASSY